MNVTINGSVCTVAPGTTVAALVRELVDVDRGVAVAIDREVVARSEWEHISVTEGARIEVVTAVAGG
jgi:sulfur carrier protein